MHDDSFIPHFLNFTDFHILSTILYSSSNSYPLIHSTKLQKYLLRQLLLVFLRYHLNEWIEESTLPLRIRLISTSFRKEGGSAGKDIRGVFRVNQVDKVKQFCITYDDFKISSKEQMHMRLDVPTGWYVSFLANSMMPRWKIRFRGAFSPTQTDLVGMNWGLSFDVNRWKMKKCGIDWWFSNQIRNIIE